MRVCFSLVGVGLLTASSAFAGFFDSNDNNNNGAQPNNRNVYYYYNDQQQGTVQIDRNRPGMQQAAPQEDANDDDDDNNDDRMSNVTSQNRTDADLSRAISDSLAGNMFTRAYKQVHVQINNGVVTLTGFVENEDQHKEVLDRVQKVGVRHIDDRITVNNPEEDQKATAPMNDQNLQKAVNEAIKGNVFAKNFKNVNAQVFNGDVTLTGFVDTDEARRDLVERVRNIDGVQNVNDRLVVRPSANYSRRTNNYIAQAAPAPATEADRVLNSKVRAALQGGFFSKGYDNILSDVRNGIVTLRGTVSSESDRKTVLDRVQKLDGVERIDNQIQMAK